MIIAVNFPIKQLERKSLKTSGLQCFTNWAKKAHIGSKVNLFFYIFFNRSSNMNYFIYTSHRFTPHGRYELNKLTLHPTCGFIVQLVEHHTGIAEVTGSNLVEALFISGFYSLIVQLNWKIYCDDHSSLSSTTAVQIWIISYILTSQSYDSDVKKLVYLSLHCLLIDRFSCLGV